MAALIKDGMLRYDEENDVAFLPRALAYQAPANPNMITAAVRRVMGVPQTALDAQFIAAAERYCQPLAQRLRERLPERFGEPSAQGLAKPRTRTHARTQALASKVSVSPGSASRDRAREAGDQGERRATDNQHLRDAVDERCRQIAGPHADEDRLRAIVDREMERLSDAIAGADRPTAYARTIAANYEPREEVIVTSRSCRTKRAPAATTATAAVDLSRIGDAIPSLY